ncbi:MAG: YgiT-type zinc finger protein [Chloroflexi bacterium]|nr:YgiT-type zinc finger protein [Chloroflexota bacterium]
MEEKTVTIARIYERQSDIPYALITDVPAEVCHQCGETVYTADVVARLQELSKRIKKGAPSAKTVEVPVYSLDDVAS